MDDDLYPNDGAYFLEEPEEQVKERRESVSKAQAARPMLLDILAHIEADMETMSSVDAIKVDPEADPEAFMRAWYGVQERKAYALSLKQHVESLLVTTK